MLGKLPLAGREVIVTSPPRRSSYMVEIGNRGSLIAPESLIDTADTFGPTSPG
jgi:hypothetical protein